MKQVRTDSGIFVVTAEPVNFTLLSASLENIIADNHTAVDSGEISEAQLGLERGNAEADYCSDARMNGSPLGYGTRRARTAGSRSRMTSRDPTRAHIMADHGPACGARGNAANYDAGNVPEGTVYEDLGKAVDADGRTNAINGLKGEGVAGTIDNSTGKFTIYKMSGMSEDERALGYVMRGNQIYVERSTGTDGRGTDFSKGQNPLVSGFVLTGLDVDQLVGREGEAAQRGFYFSVKPVGYDVNPAGLAVPRDVIGALAYAEMSKRTGHGFSSLGDQLIVVPYSSDGRHQMAAVEGLVAQFIEAVPDLGTAYSGSLPVTVMQVDPKTQRINPERIYSVNVERR